MTFELGINYWPRRRAMYMWREHDLGEVRAEMAHIADMGFDVVRIFALTEDFLPAPMRVDATMVARLVEVTRAAKEAGLRVVPTLVVLNMSGRIWWPNWMLDASGRPADLFSDPVVLRSQALLAGSGLFASDFRYREALNMKALVPSVSFLPERCTLPLQWGAAASLAVPLAHLSGAVGGPLKFERAPLRKLVEWVAPKSGAGPSDDLLAHTGYAFDIFALSAGGRRLRGRMDAQGHPGYRSTPEMAVTAAVGLADGTLGRTPHTGVVTPATGLGIEAVGAMRDAGLAFAVLA